MNELIRCKTEPDLHSNHDALSEPLPPDAPCDPLMTMIDYRRNWSIFIFIRGLNEIATCRV